MAREEGVGVLNSPRCKYLRPETRVKLGELYDNPCKDLGRTLPHIGELIMRVDYLEQLMAKLTSTVKLLQEKKSG